MLFGHGGDVYTIARELGIKPEEVLDFSSNCSPLPYPHSFKEHLCDKIDQMHLLPEVDCATIRELLAQRYALDKNDFLIGSGTTQWIFGLPRMLSPQRAYIAYPTYADYEDACLAENVEIHSIGSFPSGDKSEEERFLESLDALDADSLANSLVFICNPNNPTGLFIKPEKLLEIINRKPASATWVIDESYAPFIDDDKVSSLLTLECPSNIVILRSFSKIYGIPGLRIGCMINTGDPGKRLACQMKPWSVNRMAQLAVEFLLKYPDIERKARQLCYIEKEFIVRTLSCLNNFSYIEGKCHYALFNLKGELKAQDLSEALRRKGILIRNCNNFKGLQGEYIRISPRLHNDNERLIKEISALI